MSSVSIPVSVRFKADLSIEEFSSALSLALDGNLSGLVGAFSPTCPYLENEKARLSVELYSADLVASGIVTKRSLKEATEPVEPTPRPRRHGRGGDRTIYKLRNRDGRTASGTQADLKARLGISHVKMNRLLNTPGRTTRDGWYRPKTRAARGTKGE